ncbi:MAG TPA: hypothetical protein VJZ27_19450, partial [Aggregatilineales bacterium]|nr:hypothetical protein [Aggregatilineales bacterium]
HLMYAIVDKVKKPTGYVFVYGETEHLAAAALAALTHPVCSDKMHDAWFNRAGVFAQLTDDLMEHFDPGIYSGYYNTKSLLQTAYFQLALAEDPPVQADELRQRLLNALQAFPF